MLDRIKIALAEYGNETWPEIQTNPEVLKYFHETGYKFIDEDETPWCAAFLNWVLKKCQINTPNSLMARSFLEIGESTSHPEIGDIVVLWRISLMSPYGHCGLFIKETDKLVWILGGNQESRVEIKAFSKTQLLGYRKLPKTIDEVVQM